MLRSDQQGYVSNDRMIEWMAAGKPCTWLSFSLEWSAFGLHKCCAGLGQGLAGIGRSVRRLLWMPPKHLTPEANAAPDFICQNPSGMCFKFLWLCLGVWLSVHTGVVCIAKRCKAYFLFRSTCIYYGGELAAYSINVRLAILLGSIGLLIRVIRNINTQNSLG